MKICFPPRVWHGGPNERSLTDLYLNQPTVALGISALQICIYIYIYKILFQLKLTYAISLSKIIKESTTERKDLP